MSFTSKHSRRKRHDEREERLHFWRQERIEYPAPPLFPLHPHLSEMTKQMEEALREAIEDAKVPRKRYQATNGEFRAQRGENYRYAFRLQTFWEPQDETPIKIQIDPNDLAQVIDGIVVETDGTMIQLATEIPLPPHALPHMTFYEEKNWLLEQLLNAVTTMQETSAQLAAKTFGVIDGVDGEAGEEEMQTSIGTFMPDEDQQKALQRGCSCQVLRLIGPPGSGKTKTLTALAWYYLRQGMTVLLLSHTNVAVDNAVMSLRQLCQETGNAHWISDHRIVRIGNAKDLDAESYRDIVHDSIVDQELGVLAEARDALKTEDTTLSSEKMVLEQTLLRKQQQWTTQRQSLMHRLQEGETTLKEVKDRLDEERVTMEQEIKQQQQKRINAQQELKPLEEEEKRLKKRRATVEQEQREDHDERVAVQAEMGAVEAMSHLQRFFSPRYRNYDMSMEKQRFHRLNGDIATAKQGLECLDEMLALITFQKINPTLQIEKVDEKEAQLQQALTDYPDSSSRDRCTGLEQERDQMTADLKQGDEGVKTIEQRIERIRRRQDTIQGRLEEIGREQRLVKEQVASNADLIATTLTSVYTSPYLKGRYVDCVILDEVSMASLPAVLVAATRATQHVAVIGDPLQLAPIAGLNHERKYPKAREWLATDVFSYLQITIEQADRGEKQAVFLSRQSRMDPDIARAVSHYIYRDRLKNRDRPGYIRPAFDPLPDSAWIVIDTSDASPTECYTRRPANGESRFNEYHIECVLQLTSMIIAAGLPAFLSGRPPIGIVTPYKPQARKMREALQHHGFDDVVRAGTITAFQGREFEIVIIDLVESPDIAIPRFTSDVWARGGMATQATRLINVAHSRARSKLIYVANVVYHQQQSSKNHVLLQFINDAVVSGRLASRDLFRREEVAQ